MLEVLKSIVLLVVGLPLVVFMFGGTALGLIGIFKRKKYYASHATVFGVWKAIGFTLYLSLGVSLIACGADGIIAAFELVTVPFGNALETQELMECLGLMVFGPLAAFGWYKGYMAISRKIDEMAEKDKQWKEEGADILYMTDIVTGRKMQVRMFMAGMGSIIVGFLKVIFIWIWLGYIAMTFLGLFSNSRD